MILAFKARHSHLVWHTALCCHHDWQEKSQLQSVISVTVKIESRLFMLYQTNQLHAFSPIGRIPPTHTIKVVVKLEIQ